MKKQELTPEQEAEKRARISRIRSEAGKKGGINRKKLGYAGVGRKKGWTKDPSLKSIPSRTITVREPDYQVFVKLAANDKCPIVEFMHKVANKLRELNPHILNAPPVKILSDPK